ncbi:MAG: GIY-YIG nuclease family protein, partial [Staphylococcus equorum]
MKNRYHSIPEIMSSELFNEITTQPEKTQKIIYDPEVERFLEIVEFLQENGREPYRVQDDLRERSLA